MTTYNMMASLTFLLLLTWTLHAAPFTVYQQKDTNFKVIPLSPLKSVHESVSKCVESEKKRSAICENLKLRRVPDYLTPDIKILSLKDNLIKNLFNFSFFRYPQLTHLDIRENDIRNIESGTFQPLAYLVHLDISQNRHLEHLNPNILKLSFISIQECALKSFPQNTTFVQPFKQVRSLILDRNMITHINISCHPESQVIVDIISLQGNKFTELTHQTLNLDCDVNKLDLSGNDIISIDPYTIASLRVQSFLFGSFGYLHILVPPEVWYNLMSGIARSNTKHLSMAYIKKDDFNPHFFSPLTNYPLSTLELINAELDDSTNNVFTSLDLLLELIVTSSNIPKLEPEYFFGMNRLQILNLKNNSILEINPSNSYWSVVHVREIYLCNNDLREIMPHTFRGLANVSVLDLAYNSGLKFFKTEASLGLEYLNLSGTILFSVDLTTPLLKSLTYVSNSCIMFTLVDFNHTRLLESLDLTNSVVERGNLYSYANRSLLAGLSNLTNLSLKVNPIEHLVTGMFQGLSALEFLDLSNCQIISIEANTFRGLISLRTLTLEQNSIHQLPVNLFIDLNELVACNLMRNNLNYLDSQTFAHTTSLKTLLLAANLFTDFNRSTFDPIFALRSIDISQNPFICNCELTWLVEWLNGPINVLNVTVCSAGSGTLAPLRGKPLLTFVPNELCGPNILLVCLIPLAAIGLVATIFAVYHYRWYVKFKLHLLKPAVLGYKEVLDARDHGDFEFDLNIMFHGDDVEWVADYLKPVLEERLPNFNRNAIGDGDLILGMHYFDAVLYVIEESFKTVILLSRSAVQDNWFMIKFRIAFEQVNDARMENVVVVFLEDIPAAEIPFLVRLYLSKRRTYLEWVENERGQEYFWDELILTLQRDNVR